MTQEFQQYFTFEQFEPIYEASRYVNNIVCMPMEFEKGGGYITQPPPHPGCSTSWHFSNSYNSSTLKPKKKIEKLLTDMAVKPTHSNGLWPNFLTKNPADKQNGISRAEPMKELAP